MNIMKIGLALLTGLGFGFGMDVFTNEQNIPSEENDSFENVNYGYCHNQEYFLEHMLDNLSEEDAVVVQQKVDALLLELDITLEDLQYDYELRHEFMYALMEYIDENDIEYEYYRGPGHHGMRFR